MVHFTSEMQTKQNLLIKLEYHQKINPNETENVISLISNRNVYFAIIFTNNPAYLSTYAHILLIVSSNTVTVLIKKATAPTKNK